MRDLLQNGRVSEFTQFSPTHALEYALELTEDCGVDAKFVEGRITVGVPRDVARKWASTDQVSIEAQQPPLKILIEKDFACEQAPDDEPQDDAFPNPNKCD
jgi:hypothetical protein